jgi:uncharacterized protein YeaO (DUF488 family)
MIQVKRAYDPPQPGDGTRFLVDRLWPRGIKKEDLQVDDWLKEVAPSDDLRKWFGHDPDKWPVFKQRYFGELDARSEALEPIRKALGQGDVTLVYGARDTEHNQAVALKQYLEGKET